MDDATQLFDLLTELVQFPVHAQELVLGLPVADYLLALVQRLINFLEFLDYLLLHFDVFVLKSGQRLEVELDRGTDAKCSALHRILTARIFHNLLLDELIECFMNTHLRPILQKFMYPRFPIQTLKGIRSQNLLHLGPQMVNFFQVTYLLILIIISRGHIRLREINQLRLDLVHLDDEPVQFQLRQNIRLIGVVYALIQLLLSSGLAANLQIQLIMPIIDRNSEIFIFIEYFVSVVRFDIVFNNLTRQAPLILFRRILLEWILILSFLLLILFVYFLDNPLLRLLRTLLIFPVEIPLVDHIRHITYEHFHVLLVMDDDFWLRR